MKARWAEKAKANKEAAEKRKADKNAGIVTTNNTWGAKRQNTMQQRAQLVLKKHVQKIAATDLLFAEVKIDSVKPFAINPDDLRSVYNESGEEMKPLEPSPIFANISSASGSPFVIGLTQGGSIPQPYGVSHRESGDYGVNLIINAEEAKRLKRFSDDAEVALNARAREVYGPCFVQHDDLVMRLYTNQMPKKNKPNELWPSKLQIAIKDKDLKSGETSIVKDDGTKVTIIGNLEGMYWKQVNCHLTCAMFGWKWCDKRKKFVPQIRILVRMLGQAMVMENPDHAHLVYPHQTTEHDKQNCVCKHHTPVDIIDNLSPSEILFQEPQPNKSGIGTVVDMLAKDGTKIILKFPRGGILPSYAVDKNIVSKDTLTLQFDDTKEFAACDMFKENIIAYLLQDRSKYFGDKSEELIRGFFKPLLKDASETAGNTQCRLITAGVDLSGNGTSCMLVDENDQLLTDPEALTSCRFTEAWISIYGVYINSGEAGFIKRITYLKRAPQKVTLVLD